MDAQAILGEAVRRIATQFSPERVVLFGSRAWGTPDDESDFDFLIVAPDDADSDQLSMDIHWALRDLPASFDIVVHRHSPWAKWSAVPVTLEHRIARDGRVVYAAA